MLQVHGLSGTMAKADTQTTAVIKVMGVVLEPSCLLMEFTSALSDSVYFTPVYCLTLQ